MKAIPGHPPASDCDLARATSHLPAAKQRQLCAIVGIIRDMAEVERVILFGSHARVIGWTIPFFSDFDLAVLVASPALAEDEALWADC